MGETLSKLDLTILMPVYNDWESVKILIEKIDNIFEKSAITPRILLVDDGSTSTFPSDFNKFHLSSITNVDILVLRRNLGHQRAICIALTHLSQKTPCDAVCIMDGDGEDRPEDIPRLLNSFSKNECKKIIFAERTKRLESIVFRICYRCYQILHKLLTGHSVRVGNFSIIPFDLLSPIVVSPELWNHYAATIYNLKIPYSHSPTPRGKRISGKSKMNFIALVIHGLSAISVFGEVVGTRILFAACIINSSLIAILAVVFVIRFFSDLAIPGWATFSSGLLLILFLQVLTTTIGFLLSILNNRNTASFIPLRDYALFIHKLEQLYSKDV
jgi:glycosyltransferase involved in cell wall biosynthesis